MSQAPVTRINPLRLTPKPTPAGETAAAETAFSSSQAAGLNLQDVVCGEHNRSIPALADLSQRIVIPVNVK